MKPNPPVFKQKSTQCNPWISPTSREEIGFRWEDKQKHGGRQPRPDAPLFFFPWGGGSSKQMHQQATQQLQPQRRQQTQELGPEFGSGRGCGESRTRNKGGQMGSMADLLRQLPELWRYSYWYNKKK